MDSLVVMNSISLTSTTGPLCALQPWTQQKPKCWKIFNSSFVDNQFQSTVAKQMYSTHGTASWLATQRKLRSHVEQSLSFMSPLCVDVYVNFSPPLPVFYNSTSCIC